MGFWAAFTGGLGAIADAISKPITEWQRRKTVKAEAQAEVDKILAQAEVAKAQGILEMAKQGQKIEADWDARVQEQMRFSWKDEFLMVIFVAPFVCAFIPGLQPYIKAGFEFLDKSTPYWYIIVLLGIVASTFALRWLIAPLVSALFGKKFGPGGGGQQ